VDVTKLASLSKSIEPTPAPQPEKSAAQSAKPEDLNKANEKLSSLLGGKK
jgi:hypothetical protein